MNGLVIILIGIVVLGAGYLLYGRWLANKWGIDPNAETPAVKMQDGEGTVMVDRWWFVFRSSTGFWCPVCIC